MKTRSSNGNGVSRGNLGASLIDARRKLDEAESLRREGKLVQAQRLCEGLLRIYPDYVGMLHTLGLILADRHQYQQALPYLVQAAMLNPRDWKTQTALSGVYLKLGGREMAMRTLRQAHLNHPHEVSILVTLGEIYRDNRDYEAAAEAYRKAIELDASMHEVYSGLGNCLTHLGDFEGAARAFDSLLPHSPRLIDLLHAISQLPPSLLRPDLLSFIENAEAAEGDDKDSFDSYVAFAKAAVLDKSGSHEEAWKNLLVANRFYADRHRSEALEDARVRDLILERVRSQPAPERVFSEELLIDQPITLTILGPSRSGKTSAERIVSVLKDVRRGYENPVLENAVRQSFQMAGLPTREWIVEMPPALDSRFLDLYRAELAERAKDARVFTNTHPGHITSVLRFAHVDRNARFIFIKRNIDDVAIRIFMKKYSEGNFYSYDMPMIRNYVQWYYDMIDALSKLLPDRSRIVYYEEMVDDPTVVQRAAAELCGLELEGAPTVGIGDDRGCGRAYTAFMKSKLGV